MYFYKHLKRINNALIISLLNLKNEKAANFILILLIGVFSGFPMQAQSPEKPKTYEGKYCSGTGDTDFLRLIDESFALVPDDAAYFHAQFRRQNPDETSVYTIADNIKGKGQFVGLYMAWGVHNNGWWGEGEIKFYIDDDDKYPTICGTGTEDYFCGSYNFETRTKNVAGVEERAYTEFCTPYSGLAQVIRGDGLYNVMQRFGLYRWHIMDPIRFEKDLKVTIQDLGWRKDGRYLLQHSDISSVCFWYQAEPHALFPKLPGWQGLEN